MFKQLTCEMKRDLTSQFKQPVVIYMMAAFLLLVVFNIFLSDVLHDKVHRTGTELAKQVYELNLDPVASQDIIASLAKSQGFAVSVSDVPSNFANFINLEQEVFSYKTVNLRLFHWPSWLVESHLFIFLNLILLGAGYWGFRWWKKMFKQLAVVDKPIINPTKKPSIQSATKKIASPKPLGHQDLNILYGVPTNYNHLFALFFWKNPFPANLDVDNYFKLVIAKGFGELVNRSVKLLPSGGIAVTLNSVPATEVDKYTKRLHQVIYQACLNYRSDLSRSDIKIGVCNYRTGADQAVVYQLTKSALALAKQSAWQHIHRLPFGHTQSSILADSKEHLFEYIKKKHFMLFFQPLFDLQTGDILQHEALIRIRHKNLGLLAARHFIPHMSSKKDVLLLDKTVVSQVKKMLVNETGTLIVSINLHAMNWFNDEFWVWFKQQMDDFNCTEKLQFELSEDDYLKQHKKLSAQFECLETLSAGIVIDNVRSAEHLATYKKNIKSVRSIKLAFELIHNIDTNTQQQKTVKQIITKGTELNFPVYAVGVETQNELATLKNLGVVAAQGFYFAEPLQRLADITPHS
ncbi:EAL domain-containing protein [Pseudoalteromonas shioyasakiensis]|uniref:EAL domain-containing protein n=1 Tax=Pseudoalteromonas TaxID=53246 RepID=UPI000C90039B|nr:MULTISPECIES: EAL domain-containing protein [Pseudoalteromonas]MAD02078.1 diguanylate phosphodiesterase [Pseudoalteromonas sp.]MCP4585964.1 EAL domain-containing protein [Pseudoalteromonas sp.]MCQ8882973.1 EAL domain-containing protein [Pseudoalteromonas shioyasakiensis]QLE08309.1 EAL domain-containing protein [Pseudoalteromonas shioyasakiensis]|tara:strand:+ start:2530 stop:4257 length:1728 start_codon:yes stop_codon:yes gene_type:complete